MMAKTKAASGSEEGNEVNKSEAIRQKIREHPRAKSKQIVEMLAKDGIRVQPTLVYYIRSKRKKKRRQKGEQEAAAAPKAPSTNPVGLILKVKDLAAKAGGMRNLKQLVDALAE
jgi:hypothetical protein